MLTDKSQLKKAKPFIISFPGLPPCSVHLYPGKTAVVSGEGGSVFEIKVLTGKLILEERPNWE